MTFSLASLFTDHMVLQSGRGVPVWGWAAAGSEVEVRFADQVATTHADGDGAWRVTLEPMPASDVGRVLTVTWVDGKPRQSLAIQDVLVGEVWLCSGQSNMRWTLAGLGTDDEEIAQARDPLMRAITVPQRVSETPERTLPAGVAWQVTTPENAADFSAVGYYYGKALRKKLGVPVGLIFSSWGGTIIEAWLSRKALQSDPLGQSILAAYDSQSGQGQEAQLANYDRQVAELDEQYAIHDNQGYAKGWAGDDEPADAGWGDMTLPCFWQQAKIESNGVLWFRREVEVPQAWAGKALTLSLGAADKSDDTYFNNHRVGGLRSTRTQMVWDVPRVYTIPASLVRAGCNVVAVRVSSQKYGGGLHGPATKMHLSCPDAPETNPISLAGPWRYAVEKLIDPSVYPLLPAGPDAPNEPCRLFNAMLNPLLPYAIKGTIWYQGESNTERAHAYQTLFPLFIRSLRDHWQDAEQAFYFVQLANFHPRRDTPEDSNWARLREAQTMALALSATGMAVIIDIGNADDVHPRNKRDVGDRLARHARQQLYGEPDLVASGPLFRQAQVEGDVVRLHFDHAESGLEMRGPSLEGFAIAGLDKRFVWADACVDGQTVCVSSPQVSAPVYVRYGWQDNPPATLYNREGLPASPFRTDRD